MNPNAHHTGSECEIEDMISLMVTAIDHDRASCQDATVEHTLHHIHKFHETMVELQQLLNQYYGVETDV